MLIVLIFKNADLALRVIILILIYNVKFVRLKVAFNAYLKQFAHYAMLRKITLIVKAVVYNVYHVAVDLEG